MTSSKLHGAACPHHRRVRLSAAERLIVFRRPAARETLSTLLTTVEVRVHAPRRKRTGLETVVR